MARRLVIGAGPIGTALVEELLAAGDEVLLATRSGSRVEGARTVVLDASDRDALTRAATGAESIHVCTNPPYHRWAADWPPVIEAVHAAARATDAGIVLMSNLYMYGRPEGVMREDSPELPTETKGRVRAELWRRLREAHEAGEVRATEVRASDYFGPRAGASSHLGASFFRAVMAGRTARIVGDPMVPHAWAYAPDIARTLARVARGDAWGRVWFAPHVAQEPAARMAERINAVTGNRGAVRAHPRVLVSTLALAIPLFREVSSVAYQHRAPYLVDDVESRNALGLEPTPVDDAIRETVEFYSL